MWGQPFGRVCRRWPADLEKEEVFIVEKDAGGATRLYGAQDPPYRIPSGNRLTTTVGTSRSSHSTYAARPPGPKAPGIRASARVPR